MSQTIIVLVAIVMIGGGGYVLFSQIGSAGMSRFLVSSILVILLGFYLLWDAFLR